MIGFRNLQSLRIVSKSVRNIAPLSDISSLRHVDLNCPQVDDYSILKQLPNLRQVTLHRRIDKPIDLSSLDGVPLYVSFKARTE